MDYTCQAPFCEAMYRSPPPHPLSPPECIPAPAGAPDNSAEAPYSSIIWLTLAGLRSENVPGLAKPAGGPGAATAGLTGVVPNQGAWLRGVLKRPDEAPPPR